MTAARGSGAARDPLFVAGVPDTVMVCELVQLPEQRPAQPLAMP
jgi:hypothetical protein